MNSKVNILCVLLSLLIGIPCYSADTKNCSDCTTINACAAAVAATENLSACEQKLPSCVPGVEVQMKERLLSNACGDGKVCCSQLSTNPTSASVESVDNHPNLHLLPDECGKIFVNKLLGGRAARLYQYPWITLISYKTRLGPQFECGGSLINERYVLTAAHCITNLTLLGVRIGEHDLDTTTDCEGNPPTLTCESKLQDIRIEEAIPHPEYHGKPNIKNDIGLLRLKKPVDLSFKNAGLICLPVSRDLLGRNLGGQHATVAGWGYTEKGYISHKLLEDYVPIHTAESCRELYNSSRKPGEEDEIINKLCAGQNGRNSCGGDSGGPLMVSGTYRSSGERLVQHGIMSYGPRPCGSDFPAVYTDVSKYMKWILDNIKP